MSDPFLAVGIAILIFVMLIVNIYTLVYWQHPEDKNESYMAKVLIIFGLQLSAVSVLMIPVDVANDEGSPECDEGSLLRLGSDSYCGGIDMFAFWESMFCMICFVVVVLIPFATFFYESDAFDLTDPTKKLSRFWPAFWQESVIAIIFLIFILSLYYTKSQTEVIVNEQIFTLDQLEVVPYIKPLPGASPYSYITQTLSMDDFMKPSSTVGSTISYPVNFAVYLIGFFGWLGWWFFSSFTGIGLTSLPFDLICAFIWRPRMLAPDELADREVEIQERTNEILEITLLLKRERAQFNEGKKSRSDARKRLVTDRIEVNKLTQMVFLLERDVEELRACKSATKDYNPLIPYAKLICGIFFALISILWLLQIILAILASPEVTPFLSLYLMSFDTWFPMFGNLTYALFSLYLLICTIKGCFKLSVRFLCIKIHPMQVGGTYVSSFLFNLGIILFCTVPLIHFCVLAFSEYAVYTDAFLLFGVQIHYLHFYTKFYTNNVFIWILMLSACSILPYFFYRPRDVATSTEEFKKNLAERSTGGGGGGSGSSGFSNLAAYSPLKNRSDMTGGNGGGDIEMGNNNKNNSKSSSTISKTSNANTKQDSRFNKKRGRK